MTNTNIETTTNNTELKTVFIYEVNALNVKKVLAPAAKELGIKAKLKMDLIEALMIQEVIAFAINEQGEYVSVLFQGDLDENGVMKSRQVKREEARKLQKMDDAEAKRDARIESILNKQFLPTYKELMEELNVFDQENESNLAGEILEGMLTEGVTSARHAFTQAFRSSDLNKILIDQFLSTRYVPMNMGMTVRKSVLIARGSVADEDKLVSQDGKLIMQYDYDDLNKVGHPNSGFMMQAPSDFLNTLGYKTEMMKVKGKATVKGQVVDIDYDVTIPKSVAERMMIVDFGEYSEETAERLQRVMSEGIYINRGGELLHYVYAQRSNSQARQLNGVFVLNDTDDATGYEAIDSLFRELGTESVVYAKWNAKELCYELDGTKADKRKGLKQTTTDQMVTFQFGNTIKYVLPGTRKEVSADYAGKKDILILGGIFTMRVLAEDVYSYVKTGTYTSVNKSEKKVEELDASEETQRLIAGDGTSFASSRVGRILGTETGKLSNVFQHRMMNHIKGMIVVDDMIDDMYQEDFVVLPSSVKGDIVTTVESGHPLTLQVARFNPESKSNKEYTLFPYQFVNIIKGLTANDLHRMVVPHLNRVKDMLEDFSIMQEYLGVDDIEAIQNKIDSFSNEDEAAEYVDRKLSTRLAKAIFHSKGVAYQDAYLKRAAFDSLSLMVRKWMTGQVPVKGHYKYLLHDPKAVLNTFKMDYKMPNTCRDTDGTLIIPENIGIAGGEAVISMSNKEKGYEVPYIGDVALLRNPAVVEGEAASVKAVYNNVYAESMKKGYYANVTIVSAHDFALVRMGGADVDGDTAFVVLENILVQKIKEMDKPAVLDRWFSVDEDGTRVFDDGCPWTPEEFNIENDELPIPSVPSNLITGNQDGYRIKFTKEQYKNIELRRAIHDMEKHWVLKTLKQNMIGQLTNTATILADMKSRMANAISFGKNIFGGDLDITLGEFTHSVENYEKLIEEFEGMILWTRYAQGWEIDRAKHGGAYEMALQEELRFFFDDEFVVPLVTFMPEGSDSKRWIKPIWFNVFNKAQRVSEAKTMFEQYFAQNEKRKQHIPSMLNMHFNSMINWYSSFEGEFQVMAKDFANRNVSQFLSNIAPNRADVNVIAEALKPIKNFYNSGVTNIMNEFNAEKKELDLFLANTEDYVQHQIRLEGLETYRKDSVKNLIESAIAMVNNHDIVDQFDPAVIGYAAYEITYANRTTVESPSFPWVITEDFMMAALSKASEGMVVKDSELVDVNETLQFVVPAESGYTKETVAKLVGLTKHKGVKAVYNEKNSSYYMYAVHPTTGKYTAMGKFVYAGVTKHFEGHKDVTIYFSDVYASNDVVKDGRLVRETITVNLSVTRMQKH